MIKIIAPALLVWGIFAGVILTVPYPESFAQAKIDQIVLFFIPLFLALTITANIFLKHIPRSFSVSLAIIFFLLLKAIDSLNLVTGVLTLVSSGLLFSYFKKSKHNNLTKQSKIPKLTQLQRRKV